MRRYFFCLLTLSLGALSIAQDNPLDFEGYQAAPKAIQSFLDAPRHLNRTLGNLSPNGKWFLQSESAGMPMLADLSKEYLNLGGIQVDVLAHRSRAMTTRGDVALIFIDTADWTKRRVEAPKGTKIGGATWMPDGRTVVFMAHGNDATHLYSVDAQGGAPKRLSKRGPLLATQVGFEVADGAVFFVARTGAKMPKASTVPSQPRVQVADAAKNRLRTYRSLLSNKEEAAILEYFLTGQLVKVDLRTGAEQNVGAPAMFESVDASPKGDFLRVTTMQKPFSYIVPASSFGDREELWDMNGKALVQLRERKLTSNDAAPATPAVDARRGLAWHPDGNGLVYVSRVQEERLEPNTKPGEDDEQGRGAGGRGGAAQGDTTPRRERLVRWTAPFSDKDVKTIFESATGIGSFSFGEGSNLYISETVSGSQTTYFVDAAKPDSRKNISTFRTAEPEKNPGTLVTKTNLLGRSIVHESGGFVFLRGSETFADPSKQAPRPFLSKVEVATGKSERVWQSAENAYEVSGEFLAADGSKFVADRQSPTEVNNTWLVENGKLTRALTENKDYAPDLTEAKRYRIQVTRADGFKFWVRVTAPKWSWPGSKLPAMFWFYPGEFTDQAAYDRGQRSFNKNLFPNIGQTNMALLTRLGYAFVEPDCPIVGPQGRINDFYVNDLRNNLSATIDELERQGLIDRTKLAIGGHSYGGFSTANAMVHTPFFKAGIAGAGNFNRTLTPMSFQSETRLLFEARETYLNMSPILYAENLTGALLMYCGMEDQNVGTDPVNSVRMFHVLESIGKPAALYMYPHEDHGQIAKETIQDMWARWVAWLTKYVK